MLAYVAAITIGFVAVVVLTRRTWDKTLERESPQTLAFPPLYRGRPAKHRRVELEFHDHRHWGVKWQPFANPLGAGLAVHVGIGRTCLCIDVFARGRRP
jgi:hypothetical protein